MWLPSQQTTSCLAAVNANGPKQHDLTSCCYALPSQGFGDVFVCRIAGNIATAEEIASLEYAVIELGVKVILVMGHTSCGAVKAALSGKQGRGRSVVGLAEHGCFDDLHLCEHTDAGDQPALLQL